jgi:quinol monooxygenase YgiN
MVGIRVPSEHRDEVVGVLTDDARKSVSDEPGCYRFDLLQDDSDPNVIRLYEVYKDRAAHKYHTEQPYFQHWQEVRERTGVEVLARWASVNLFPENRDWR